MIRRLLLTAVLFGTLAAPALAGPPPGDWTYLRKDNFRHYACKAKAGDGTWKIRTATWFNGRDAAVENGIGAYAALARGGNDNLVDARDQTNWRDGYIRLVLRGAVRGDRVWVQGSYYGPPEPWSDGFRVANITRC